VEDVNVSVMNFCSADSIKLKKTHIDVRRDKINDAPGGNNRSPAIEKDE
jgi:hypothetical protein